MERYILSPLDPEALADAATYLHCVRQDLDVAETLYQGAVLAAPDNVLVQLLDFDGQLFALPYEAHCCRPLVHLWPTLFSRYLPVS